MTKAKTEEKKKAREYRRQGKSILWIARKLNVAKSSVSTWTRDIELTDEQYEYLQNSEERQEAQRKAAEANVIVHRNKRLKYQESGRKKAREGCLLHQGGCMLYWAEGKKTRNTVEFVNSDPDMIGYFMQFLRECLHTPDKKIKFRINAYLGNGLSEQDIINYWIHLLGLSLKNMNKPYFNKQPSSSNQRGRKLLYGTCEIIVGSTRLSQHIYGAIQEYTGIGNPEWLDL